MCVCIYTAPSRVPHLLSSQTESSPPPFQDPERRAWGRENPLFACVSRTSEREESVGLSSRPCDSCRPGGLASRLIGSCCKEKSLTIRCPSRRTLMSLRRGPFRDWEEFATDRTRSCLRFDYLSAGEGEPPVLRYHMIRWLLLPLKTVRILDNQHRTWGSRSCTSPTSSTVTHSP